VRTVLVTGAAGKTGSAVLAALRDRGARSVGLVRSPAHDAPAADSVVLGDQRDVDVLTRALAGVDAAYAIAPNLSPDEVAMALAMVEACRRAGVRRLVLHSVIHPQLSAMPHHADKGRAEEVVVESGLDWTILQPNAYLQNLTGYVAGMRAGRYAPPYRIDRGSALVDLWDVAEVAARVLIEDIGIHATFELSGPRACTPADVARAAADILGQPVQVERTDPAAFVAGSDLDPERRQRLLAMLHHYDRYGSPGDDTVLRMLLGREPRGLPEVLAVLLGDDPPSRPVRPGPPRGGA
jgi:NAD(P)H dehydrogenase (quinone)